MDQETISLGELTSLKAELEQLRRENARLASLAYRDALTGLRNRRFFNERLGEELCRMQRTGETALSVICIDLNDFKLINDQLGHNAGDEALSAVGRFLEALTRSTDLVCRVGGDEFTIILPDTDAHRCAHVLDRIRRHMSALRTVGLSDRGLALGMASYHAGDDEFRLLARADEALYADKNEAHAQIRNGATPAVAGAAPVETIITTMPTATA